MPGQNYTNAWSHGGIWGNSIGSGMNAQADANRQGRSVQPGAVGAAKDPNGLETPGEVTGSGSLLESSESENWGGLQNSQWPALGTGIGGNRPMNNGSPARPRTTQNNRSDSPYRGGVSAIGTAAGKQRGLDPTAGGFNSNFGNPFQNANPHDNSRRNMNAGNFGNMGMNGNGTNSGFASSPASRSGSLPPSRHGNDPMMQLSEAANQALHQSNSEIFSHRPNQQSRSGFPQQQQQQAFGDGNLSLVTDLASQMSKLDFARSGSVSATWDQPPSFPGAGFPGSAPYSRKGSLSFEPGDRLMQSMAQNPAKYGYHDPGQSPNGSDQNRSHDSPLYLSSTPPMNDHVRNSSIGSRTNFSTAAQYNQAALDYKLKALAEQRAYNPIQPSPSTAYRQLYYQGHEMNPHALNRMGMNQPFYGQVNSAMYPNNIAQAGRMPRGPTQEMGSDNLRSALMEEFRYNKGSKKYELKDIYGHVVEFSGDQHGSRFIQQKLETANSDEKAQLFNEILPNSLQLMTDVFGNYVIQKFFEHGNQTQKKQLAEKMKGHIAELSTQMYGCRVVQKAFEHILVDQQASLVKELEPKILSCVKDQNGNHVVQKAIQRIPAEHIAFIINAFVGQVHILATHTYGCRVVQRMLEHAPEPARIQMIEEVHSCALSLIPDQFGNYVAQHVIEHGRSQDRTKIIELAIKNVVQYSRHKYASNVIEKCLDFGTDEQKARIVEIISATEQKGEQKGDTPIAQLMRDSYGNYVIQKIVRLLEPPELLRFVELLRPHLPRAKQYPHMKQINQVEKAIEMRLSQINGGGQAGDENVGQTPPPLVQDAQSPQSSSQPSTNNSTVDGPVSGSEDVSDKSSPDKTLTLADSASATPRPSSNA